MKVIRYIFVLLLVISSTPLFSQGLSQHKKKKILRKARYHFNTASYYKALDCYRTLLDNDSLNKTYLYETGLSYYYTNFEKSKALPYILKSQANSGADTIPETYFIIAEILHLQGKFEDALLNYKRYKALVDDKGVFSDGKTKRTVPEEIEQKIQWCFTGIRLRDSVRLTLTFPGEVKKSVFKLVRLDSTVNSMFDDYSTLLSPNDDKLYFTTRRKDGIKNYIDYFDTKHFEDIYVSEVDGKTWKSAVSIPGNINTVKRHEATNFLSKDGKTLYVYQGVRTGTMYVSTESGGSWSKPTKVKGSGLNSKHWETSLSFCLSNDQVMYIVSDRPGGIGGRDIYTCKKQADGNWGPLENMGASINSKYDEDGPYITPDGKTLYFSSNGPGSIGGFDIFRCQLLDGKWSTPINLGKPMNSTGDDIYFQFANTSHTAYVSSSRPENGYTDMDIYRLEEECLNPDKIPVIGRYHVKTNVKISFTKSGEQSGADYELLAKSDTTAFGPIVLDAGATYDLLVKTELGQVKMSVNIPRTCTSNPYFQEIFMNDDAQNKPDTITGRISIKNAFFDAVLESGSAGDPTKAGFGFIKTLKGSDPALGYTDTTFVLKKLNQKTPPSWFFTPVYFAFDKFDIRPQHQKELDQLILALKANPDLKIELQGHTDSKGKPGYNEKLSMRRVAQVAYYLYAAGVNSNQITKTYYGESRPAFPNNTIENRQKNRRVEILIIGKPN